MPSHRVAPLRWLAGALVWLASVPAAAQDARRGAALYMQLPGGVASCVSCHGPEPQGNRNSLLKAADNPLALTKALSTVGVMSSLRASLDDTGIQDLAAFLGSANRASAVTSVWTIWPLTADFGTLGLGAAAGPQRVQVFNRGTAPLRLDAPQLQGAGFTLQSGCGATLAAGATCEMQIRAEGGSMGALLGALQLTSPDVPGPLVVALAATVRASAAGVLQWQPDPGVAAWGALASGASDTRAFELVNAGADAVTLGAAPAVAGSLTLTGANLVPLNASGCAAGTVLPPSARCAVSVRMAGGSPSQVRAVLQVRSNGQNPSALRLDAEPSPGAPPPAASAAPVAAATPPPASRGGGASGAGWLLGLMFAVLGLGLGRPRR